MDRWDIRSVAVAGSAWCGGMPEPHPKTTRGKAPTDVLWLDWSLGSTMITRYTLAINLRETLERNQIYYSQVLEGVPSTLGPHGEVERVERQVGGVDGALAFIRVQGWGGWGFQGSLC